MGMQKRGVQKLTQEAQRQDRDRHHRGYGQSWLPRQLVFMKGFNLKLLVAT